MRPYLMILAADDGHGTVGGRPGTTRRPPVGARGVRPTPVRPYPLAVAAGADRHTVCRRPAATRPSPVGAHGVPGRRQTVCGPAPAARTIL